MDSIFHLNYNKLTVAPSLKRQASIFSEFLIKNQDSPDLQHYPVSTILTQQENALSRH